MRNFGLVLAILGGGAFYYCSSHLEGTDPIPESATLVESVRFYERGRLELGRFAGAGGAAIGLLLAAASKGD